MPTAGRLKTYFVGLCNPRSGPIPGFLPAPFAAAAFAFSSSASAARCLKTAASHSFFPDAYAALVGVGYQPLRDGAADLTGVSHLVFPGDPFVFAVYLPDDRLRQALDAAARGVARRRRAAAPGGRSMTAPPQLYHGVGRQVHGTLGELARLPVAAALDADGGVFDVIEVTALF